MIPDNNQKEELQEKLFGIKREEEEKKTEILAKKFGRPYLNLNILPVDKDDLSILSEESAREGEAAALKKTGRVLHLGVRDPENEKTKKIIEDLKKQGYELKVFVVSFSGLNRIWEKYKLIAPEAVSLRGVFNIQENELREFEKSLETIQKLKEAITDLPTTNLLATIVAGAIKMNASDIHFEPTKNDLRLRYRIDGVLQDAANLSQKQYFFLLSRIKTLSDLFLNVKDIGQDGRFTIKITGKEKRAIDVRVSVLPSNHGETIVMRLLGTSATKLNLDKLGMEPEMFEAIKTQINQPNGMILSTGPTGSGKTTTLYACLNYVNKPGIKIITVENPIEYQLEGITQTQVEEKSGYIFAGALRSIVRQDPDVLMVGEIRDKDSAEIAVQFSLTGHIVFSTLHTNDAVGAVPRLIGMGVEPSSLSSSLKIVVAQRLVRQLCQGCKKEIKPPKEILESVNKIISSLPKNSGIKIPDQISFYESKGCPQCHGLGYQGRTGIFEIMAVDKKIEKLILNKATSYQLFDQAVANGMVTLVQDAVIKAARGITSLEEVEGVVGSLKVAAEKTKTPH
ncbi:MAG: hypothetical protein COY10_01095 [Candidatus Portnoybacteria bacterium CG_4_10_14_0_2_um_filter_43_36]|uniref:Bacterial type II secretion system protein E domain-containing protein n=2 Tax=Candidatus Portnoyibacteriota TaxID=1817913 RepID=A0A2M7UEJ4_9BACT|nr:MAG: hypothetical protein COY10_01095 [Candidatus Portnoybacteria bacterium CG_4_10_14_0_2_um_filter_43_36]